MIIQVDQFQVEFDFVDPQNTVEKALKKLKELDKLQEGETVVTIGAISVGTEIVDSLQMRVL